MAEGVKLRLGFLMRLRASCSLPACPHHEDVFIFPLFGLKKVLTGTSCTGRLGALLARRAAFLNEFLELAEKLRKQTNKQAGYL